MPERRTYLRSVAAVATGITLSGCSGDGDGSDGGGGSDGDGDEAAGSGDSDGDGDGPGGDSTPTATATPTTTATPATDTTSGSGPSAQDEYPDYNWAQLDGVSAEDATAVEITGFSYDPLVARIPAGESIPFPNTDSVPHTVTAPAAGVDVTVQPGEEGTVTVDEPGTYDYVCRFHPPEMLGRLVVVDGSSAGERTPTPTPESTPTDAPDGTETPTQGGGGGAY